MEIVSIILYHLILFLKIFLLCFSLQFS